jgi:mannose-6-phosphate isomerase-like protein (cupin superfamily)
MPPAVIDIYEKLGMITEHWRPGIIAKVNAQHLKLAKILGNYVWHSHEETDEAFYVIEGRMWIDFRDGAVELTPGRMCVIPRGMEHRPRSEKVCHILLVEAAGTVSTGDARPTEKTTAGEWI